MIHDKIQYQGLLYWDLLLASCKYNNQNNAFISSKSVVWHYVYFEENYSVSSSLFLHSLNFLLVLVTIFSLNSSFTNIFHAFRGVFMFCWPKMTYLSFNYITCWLTSSILCIILFRELFHLKLSVSWTIAILLILNLIYWVKVLFICCFI